MSQITIFSAPMITLLLCSFSLYCANAARLQLSVQPARVETGLNEWANFSCSLRCDFKNFNIKWAVGFNIRRRVVYDNTSRILEETDNCDSDNEVKRFGQTLRILVDSIDMDKTPIQCLALPKSNDGETIHFSSYAVLRVNAPVPKVEIRVPESVPDCRQTTQEKDRAVAKSTAPNTKQLTQQPGMALSAASTLSPTLLLTLLIGLLSYHVVC